MIDCHTYINKSVKNTSTLGSAKSPCQKTNLPHSLPMPPGSRNSTQQWAHPNLTTKSRWPQKCRSITKLALVNSYGSWQLADPALPSQVLNYYNQTSHRPNIITMALSTLFGTSTLLGMTESTSGKYAPVPNFLMALSLQSTAIVRISSLIIVQLTTLLWLWHMATLIGPPASKLANPLVEFESNLPAEWLFTRQKSSPLLHCHQQRWNLWPPATSDTCGFLSEAFYGT